MILTIVLTTCTLSTDDDGTDDNDVPLVGAQLQYPVTLDGQISSADEWSDTDSIDMDWGLDIPPGPPYVNARIWAKNDNTWLYLLYRVEWPSTDTDVTDGGQISRSWGNYGPPWDYADLGFMAFGGGSWDAYGWDDTQWYYDTDDGGENNVLVDKGEGVSFNKKGRTPISAYRNASSETALDAFARHFELPSGNIQSLPANGPLAGTRYAHLTEPFFHLHQRSRVVFLNEEEYYILWLLERSAYPRLLN